MSRALRAHHRRQARAAARTHELGTDPDDDVGMLIGWCDGEDLLEEAKKQTHDKLIALMGARRTGGVTWRIFDRPEAYRFLEKVTSIERGPELLDHYRRVRGFLRENGGLMIVATAPGTPPGIVR